MDVVYQIGDYHPPPGVIGAPKHQNRNELQAVLRFTLKSVHPRGISLSEGASADPSSPAMAMVVNVRQTWSAQPGRPLTFSCNRTVLSDHVPSSYVGMAPLDGGKLSILGGPAGYFCTRGWNPEAEDWNDVLPFVTVPPGDEGLTVPAFVAWERILRYRDDEKRMPRPGDEYDVSFSPGRRSPFCDWWNWGDLEGDLKDKKLRDMVDPRLNDESLEHPGLPPEGYLLPYGAWSEQLDGCDDEGNEMIWLQVHYDTTPVRVKFVA